MVRACYVNTNALQTDPSLQRSGVALESEAKISKRKYHTSPAPPPDGYRLQSSHPCRHTERTQWPVLPTLQGALFIKIKGQKLFVKSQITNGHDRILKLHLQKQAVGQTWSVGRSLLLASDLDRDVNVVHGSCVRSRSCSAKPGRSFTKDFRKVTVSQFGRKVRSIETSSTSKSLLKFGYKRRNKN